MARPLTPAFHEALGSAETRDPFVWLIDIEVPTVPITMFRLTTGNRSVDYGQTSAGVPLTYSAAGIQIENIEETGDGSLPEVRLVVANASQFARQILTDHNGLTGQPVSIRLINVGLLSGPDVSIEWRGRIGDVSQNVQAITIPINNNAITDLVFPGRRDLEDSCAVRKFGVGPCPYPVNAVGAAFSTCSRNKVACGLRGADMVSLGFPALLPRQFGGMPGLGQEQ